MKVKSIHITTESKGWIRFFHVRNLWSRTVDYWVGLTTPKVRLNKQLTLPLFISQARTAFLSLLPLKQYKQHNGNHKNNTTTWKYIVGIYTVLLPTLRTTESKYVPSRACGTIYPNTKPRWEWSRCVEKTCPWYGFGGVRQGGLTIAYNMGEEWQQRRLSAGTFHYARLHQVRV